MSKEGMSSCKVMYSCFAQSVPEITTLTTIAITNGINGFDS